MLNGKAFGKYFEGLQNHEVKLFRKPRYQGDILIYIYIYVAVCVYHYMYINVFFPSPEATFGKSRGNEEREAQLHIYS